MVGCNGPIQILVTLFSSVGWLQEMDALMWDSFKPHFERRGFVGEWKARTGDKVRTGLASEFGFVSLFGPVCDRRTAVLCSGSDHGVSLYHFI